MRRLSAKSPPALETLLASAIERTAAEPGYWTLDHYYELDGEAVERLLIPAVGELWDICLEFVARAVRDDEVLSSLGIPEHAWAGVAGSWTRGDAAPLARFDLSFDGKAQPRLHECNIDVVGLLYEATYFQRAWMAHQHANDPGLSGRRQLTGIDALLAGALAPAAQGPIKLLSIGPDPYDELWIFALSRMLGEHGLASDVTRFGSASAFLAWVEAGGLDAPDLCAVKAFRWDLLLPHAGQIRSLATRRSRLMSPMWSLVLSSKGCLPWLWRMNPGHPNLLEACFEGETLSSPDGFVSKPLFSIQGRNIALSDARHPARNMATGGASPPERRIYQELCYLAEFSTRSGCRWASTGAWVANGKPAGISMTEAGSPIIAEASIRYVPHVLR